MVHKSSKSVPSPPARRRGRPRAYDPDEALARAMETFWKSGYAATTLDDLSAATGMNRPSLYAAFGDKQEIYAKAYQHYRQRVRNEFAPLLNEAGPIRRTLQRVFEAASALYLSGPDGPRGCLSVVTVASEAVDDPEIRKLALDAIASLDRAFATLFSNAIARGELPQEADAAALGKIATATLHTLAVRARAGIAKRELDRLIDGAVGLICGPVTG